jgi:hypothetical protein
VLATPNTPKIDPKIHEKFPHFARPLSFAPRPSNHSQKFIKTQNPLEKTILPLKASKVHIFTTVTPISAILAPKFSESLPLLFYAFINLCLLHID